MDKLKIMGGTPLKGEIRVGGAKNAALPLMAASLLTKESFELLNVPDLQDILSFKTLLEDLGVKATYEKGCATKSGGRLELRAEGISKICAEYELVRKMRASILVLGPLLARFKEASVSLPGGCAIGTRPVDLHIKGMEALGAEIRLEEGYIHAKAPQGLQGGEYIFPTVSVTGTENLVMAATLAKGKTTLRNVAREPEVIDLCHCLIKMGAKIAGIGTDTLVIEGVDTLKGVSHSIIPDRIEAGTFLMAALMTRGELLVKDLCSEHLSAPIKLLESCGGVFSKEGKNLRVAFKDRIIAKDVVTEPYPAFPTDLQAQFMTLMTLAEGASSITETIFENRFMHVAELTRMGADIQIHGSAAFVKGVKELVGAPVMATDLRASASLVIAGIAALGETVVSRIYHLDRGYEHIEEKLRNCGANVKRVS